MFIVADMSWSGWASLGGSLDGDRAVGSNRDGRLEVFAVWRDGTLQHMREL
jgi:hypothetical protein